MVSRDRVYAVIDSERDYQDSRWTSEHDEQHSISDWLIFMEMHLEEAKKRVYELSDEEVLMEIRKLTALGVACMEYNGAPRRDYNALDIRTSHR